jgi:hypothetical protein
MALPMCRASRGSPECVTAPFTTASYSPVVAGVIRCGDCGYSSTGSPSAARIWSDRAQRNGSATIWRTCQRRHASRTASSTSRIGTRYSGRPGGGSHRPATSRCGTSPTSRPRDQRGRVLRERPVEREDPLGAIRDGPRIGTAGPGPRWQPGVGQLLGELAQPGPAKGRLPGLRRQERADDPLGQEVPKRWVRQLPAVPAVDRVVLEPGRRVLAPDERLVLGMLGGPAAHVREHGVGPVRGRGADPQVREASRLPEAGGTTSYTSREITPNSSRIASVGFNPSNRFGTAGSTWNEAPRAGTTSRSW